MTFPSCWVSGNVDSDYPTTCVAFVTGLRSKANGGDERFVSKVLRLVALCPRLLDHSGHDI